MGPGRASTPSPPGPVQPSGPGRKKFVFPSSLRLPDCQGRLKAARVRGGAGRRGRGRLTLSNQWRTLCVSPGPERVAYLSGVLCFSLDGPRQLPNPFQQKQSFQSAVNNDVNYVLPCPAQPCPEDDCETTTTVLAVSSADGSRPGATQYVTVHYLLACRSVCVSV